MNATHRLLAAASLSTLLLAGCHVTETGTGPNKKVDIGTPFGSMKVNTNDAGDLSAIGLSAYPGAVPDKGDNDKDEHNNADVNLSFGDFHLGVKAASFHTPDSTEKVLAFYRKDLHTRYGDVIECQDDKPVGTPTRTSQGLSCDDAKGVIKTSTEETKKNGISFSKTVTSHDSVELRSGSQQHQHIVGVDPKDGGTKIGLVVLDLPSHFGDHNGKDPE